MIDWDLQGPDSLRQPVRARLGELEPGFAGQVRFCFDRADHDRALGLHLSFTTGGRSLTGQGSAAWWRAVCRQLSPWISSQRFALADQQRLVLRLLDGDERRSHLLAHLAEGAVLGLAERLGEGFSFPCSSRGYEERDLTVPSGAGPAGLERCLAGTGLAGLGAAFCRAEAEAGVNCIALAALAAWQSAWGTSRLAREQGNPLGWRAAGSIAQVAAQIRCHYLTPGGAHYHGANLMGMNVRYAVDPTWRHGVAAVWRQLADRP